jgi:hypothetical protein
MAPRILLLMAIAAFEVAQAKAACVPPDKSAGSFDQAIERVSHVREFLAWKSGHRFPVAYGLGPDEQLAIGGKCFWEVPVYADRPERLEHWQTFYVAADSKTIYVFDDALAQPVTLAEWRKGQEQ